MSPNHNSGSTAGWFCRTRPRRLGVDFWHNIVDGGLFHFSFYSLLVFYTSMERFDCYKLLILWTYRQFSGLCWLNYDRAFRERPAAVKLTNSSAMNVQLFNYHTATIQFVLAQLQPIQSPPRQRPLVALLVKLFTILWMRVAASLSILAVDSAMHVAGVVAIIMLLLVLLCV